MSAGPRPATHHRQAGVAVLPMVLLLLIAMTLATLYINRALVFEQRSSANQLRAARAFAAAEAGLEWANALLNDPRLIDEHCTPAHGGMSFRERHTPLDTSLVLVPSAARPGCRIGASGLMCRCDGAGASTSWPSPSAGSPQADDARFVLGFAPVADDAQAIAITSHGCTSPEPGCGTGASIGAMHAVARVSAVFKLRPALRLLPAAALTAKGDAVIDGPLLIANTGFAARGVLVDAGGDALVDPNVRLETLPGRLASHAVIGHDSMLAALGAASGASGADPANANADADADALFRHLHATTPPRFAGSPNVFHVRGSSATDNAHRLLAAADEGHAAFAVEGGLDFDTSVAVVGSAARPVLIAGADSLVFRGPTSLHGLVHLNADKTIAEWRAGATLTGALVASGDVRLTATPSAAPLAVHLHPAASLAGTGGALVHDLPILKTLRLQAGAFVRVPGSWRDF